MHENIIAYNQRLIKTGSEYTGRLENPSIFLRTLGDVSAACGASTDDFMDLYIQVVNNLISDIKYQCIGDPTTNVAIEILCTLLKGKTLDEAALIKEDAFSRILGCEDEGMQEKAKFLLELLNEEILRYKTQAE
ncbi:iron-sulfur cluster assembly scaffold protein [Pelotomaculum terephthalicicum JT]|uniref:iron-sulfur cluster assembly scaffold protein n=1 Tax=Pelotomaculum TaxID=191373 RepID=UPI0009CCDEEA|nr:MULTISPECIES: iron-sulfur cluster assembly scaffold protein [Pelotomaculum]MCG9968759.1 iron-sulfur cluster assembly scaffold protein [Pelotomaculum terephthalicicum JT]OPX84617.1 MAG: hypothetical protein A4E54_02802 [Pelotomaculum sp. PtaB.Bin117]OPY63340.1 MAG: hypothetical protein A4E56_00690 [Pelotomaculum sp. PtaU1.Bin065]